ncbi:unnamed protein product [Urochloa humidicola]
METARGEALRRILTPSGFGPLPPHQRHLAGRPYLHPCRPAAGPQVATIHAGPKICREAARCCIASLSGSDQSFAASALTAPRPPMQTMRPPRRRLRTTLT